MQSIARQTRQTPDMFDFKNFLTQNFGNAGSIMQLVSGYGLVPPPRDTVRKWFQRGSMPGCWLALLCALHEFEYGRSISFTPYISGHRSTK